MRDARFDQLLDVLERCMTACESCAGDTIGQNGGGHQRLIRLALDCGEICGFTARFVARDSEFKEVLLRQCAIVCKACEDECRRHQIASAVHCAEVCHECHLACALVSSKQL